SVLEGARQIVALLILPEPKLLAQVVLDELPSIEGVLACETMTVLRWYRSGYDWMMTNTISPEIRAAAQAEIIAALDEDAAPVTDLTEQDEQLIGLLAEEGRMPATRLAQLIGAKTGVVRRRAEQLIASGTLRVRAEVAPGVFGLRIEAMAWLRVPPGQLDEMGRILAASGEVRFCSAVTGEHQMMVDMLARSEEELLEFLSDVVSRVPGARIGEVDLVLSPVRRGPLTIIDEE
ncbi:Lrp/AsnC family transcriptional regulator, partial [Leucobacter sp. M11]|uniref:Lrp/AsnC family transcriptional regulator n=1 Tax=Leucobacter sp. M11 TaxID=2993565 RepID=UPI002D8053EF